MLTKIGERLTRSGATASTSPNKVAKALAETPGIDQPQVSAGRNATAGDVIRAYLAEHDDALIAGDLTLRRGLGGIHPTRVATRRLRSTLRIFAAYFDPDRAQFFDANLSWYADLLGEVRDREVQRARFGEMIADLPAEQVLGPVAARIEENLLAEQVQHRRPWTRR